MQLLIRTLTSMVVKLLNLEHGWIITHTEKNMDEVDHLCPNRTDIMLVKGADGSKAASLQSRPKYASTVVFCCAWLSSRSRVFMNSCYLFSSSSSLLHRLWVNHMIVLLDMVKYNWAQNHTAKHNESSAMSTILWLYYRDVAFSERKTVRKVITVTSHTSHGKSGQWHLVCFFNSFSKSCNSKERFKFRITGLLSRESSGDRWIPPTNASSTERVIQFKGNFAACKIELRCFDYQIN